MASPKHFNDPEYWRARSEEIRTVAEGLKDPAARRMMLGIAADYDFLAQRATERLLTGKKLT